ncbi:Uncharacterised protein [BD1-7 clade bacterium]|uniref:Uncharacterized protein n=1 Tax=BD1-7 clade bacterium TaxID=2029982 RepID=A0A5S9PWT0_9GAMM|nr:Uncharacterised protein [BD1-7 clade bacterium]CAA0113313.1 Uncharacterised protein [BD1-7 clade bacterium]
MFYRSIVALTSAVMFSACVPDDLDTPKPADVAAPERFQEENYQALSTPTDNLAGNWLMVLSDINMVAGLPADDQNPDGSLNGVSNSSGSIRHYCSIELNDNQETTATEYVSDCIWLMFNGATGEPPVQVALEFEGNTLSVVGSDVVYAVDSNNEFSGSISTTEDQDGYVLATSLNYHMKKLGSGDYTLGTASLTVDNTTESFDVKNVAELSLQVSFSIFGIELEPTDIRGFIVRGEGDEGLSIILGDQASFVESDGNGGMTSAHSTVMNSVHAYVSGTVYMDTSTPEGAVLIDEIDDSLTIDIVSNTSSGIQITTNGVFESEGNPDVSFSTALDITFDPEAQD